MGIADDIKKLGEDIVTSYDMRVKAIGELATDVHKKLEGFAAERKDMAAKQAKALRDFVTDLTKKVGAMIKSLQKEHKEMADNLREGLKKGETERLKSFEDMMGGIKKGIKDIESYVANKLKEFNKAHADMSAELKKALAKYVDDMVKATKKLMGDIQKRQEERNAEVADLLEAYKTEREKMAANWRSMAATMEKKRVKPRVEAEVKVRPVKEAVEEVEAGLEEKVLEFIKRNPEGVKVSDMEEPLGVGRTRLGVISKKLFEEDKVRKEGNIYFPI